jgi:hypothetical protein
MITVSQTGLTELTKALKGVERKISINLAAAINATAKKTTTYAARELKSHLTVPVGILKKALRAKSKASANRLQARIEVWEGYPIPLKYFRAKQTKKSGVTYKVDPKAGRKSIIRDAFIAKQYGNNVYKRVGKDRGPLEKLHGPSPGIAFKEAGLEDKVRRFAEAELPKQIDRRIRLALLREAGIVNQRKGS